MAYRKMWSFQEILKQVWDFSCGEQEIHPFYWYTKEYFEIHIKMYNLIRYATPNRHREGGGWGGSLEKTLY